MSESPTITPAGRARRILDSLTILLFLALIFAPTIDTWIRPDSSRSPELIELRTPAAKPAPPATAAAAIQYPTQYESYFKDTFGLRDQLLRWNSILKVFGFGVSPSSEVYFGKAHWIFYNGEHSKENHRGAYPFQPEELQHWARALERKRALLELLGTRYIYVFAPDKETVYPELLPEYMRPIGPTRRTQFLAYMRENAPKVEILDLSDVLIADKRNDTPGEWAYGPLGTHWTGRGAQAGLRALLERLKQMQGGGFAPEELDSFQRIEFPGNGDSWAARMYIGNLLTQRVNVYKPLEVHAAVIFESAFTNGRIRKSVILNSARPRVILMHDSFGPSIELGLSEQCAFLDCRWGVSIDPADIESDAPDVFIDMYVERMLNHLDPTRLLPMRTQSWPALFESSTRTLVSLDLTRSDWGITGLEKAQVGPAVSSPRPRLPIVISQASDRLSFPILTPIQGEVPVLHVTIDSPCATNFALYFRPPGATAIRWRNAYKHSLVPGTNDFYLPLDRPETSGDLVVRPGEQLGTYLLRDFEIRSVKTP